MYPQSLERRAWSVIAVYIMYNIYVLDTVGEMLKNYKSVKVAWIVVVAMNFLRYTKKILTNSHPRWLRSYDVKYKKAILEMIRFWVLSNKLHRSGVILKLQTFHTKYGLVNSNLRVYGTTYLGQKLRKTNEQLLIRMPRQLLQLRLRSTAAGHQQGEIFQASISFCSLAKCLYVHFTWHKLLENFHPA